VYAAVFHPLLQRAQIDAGRCHRFSQQQQLRRSAHRADKWRRQFAAAEADARILRPRETAGAGEDGNLAVFNVELDTPSLFQFASVRTGGASEPNGHDRRQIHAVQLPAIGLDFG
jgi:hypothetical protein